MATHNVETFCDRVDEVCRLVDGLKAGTLSPDHVEDHLEKRTERSRNADSQDPLALTPERKAKLLRQVSFLFRSVRLMLFVRSLQVEDLKERQEKKEKRRDQYNAYVCHGKRDNGSTDYRQWELWCPSDEDDEIVRSCLPNRPECQALDRDMKERRERCG